MRGICREVGSMRVEGMGGGRRLGRGDIVSVFIMSLNEVGCRGL